MLVSLRGSKGLLKCAKCEDERKHSNVFKRNVGFIV